MSKWYTCDKCPYRNREMKNLRSHWDCHAITRRFVCGSCGGSFKVKRNLVRHDLRYHATTRNYSCPREGCGKRFKAPANLRQHERNVHSLEKNVCRLCNKAIGLRPLVRLHIYEVHLKAFRYLCNTCNYRTFKRAYMGQHLRSQKHLTAGQGVADSNQILAVSDPPAQTVRSLRLNAYQTSEALGQPDIMLPCTLRRQSTALNEPSWSVPCSDETQLAVKADTQILHSFSEGRETLMNDLVSVKYIKKEALFDETSHSLINCNM